MIVIPIFQLLRKLKLAFAQWAWGLFDREFPVAVGHLGIRGVMLQDEIEGTTKKCSPVISIKST